MLLRFMRDNGSMHEIKLKICGLMRREDVQCCFENGVDIAGFVTEYPLSVPWNLTEQQTAALLPAVSAPMKSCIVTGGGFDKINALVQRLHPDFVQLHYHETFSDTYRLARLLSPLGIGVIKTLPAKAEERRRQFGTSDVSDCVRMLNDSGVYAILIDARGPSGTEEAVPETMNSLISAARQAASIPFILAGGITAENVSSLCEAFHPGMVDVMTGVEISYGVKSPQKIAELSGRLEQIK